MKPNTIFRHSWIGLLVTQILFLVIMIQIMQIPIVPQPAAASPPTHLDNIWEDPDGLGPLTNNSRWAWAYPLGGESIANPDLLNVSSSNPDYYSFDVKPGFYFSISITFNQTNIWEDTGVAGPNNFVDLEYPYADLDIYLWAQNGTLLGYSNYSGYEEIISPILIRTSETLIFNITCSTPAIGDVILYSTTYNMSVVYEDKWEYFAPNDHFDDLTPPNYPGGSDDEIVPGHYEKLRFSQNTDTLYGNNDTYWILLYQGSWVNITVTSYLDSGQDENNGPDMHLYFSNKTLFDSQFESNPTVNYETFITTVKYTDWYYLEIRNNAGIANYYTLDITLEDAYEVESGPNHVNNTATEIKNFGKLPGMVISNNNHDWYTVNVEKYKRLLVDINWVPVKLPDGSKLDLSLTVYENQSASSILDDPQPILNGLRFGPYRALSDSVFYIHVSSNNPYPLYYNLTISIREKDDWAEVNDGPLTAYILPTQSKVYSPTENDPDAGLISLEGNMDWFGIYLLPGDWLTVRIDFDGSLADLNLFLASQDGVILDDSTSSGSSSETVVYNVVKADMYLLLILGVGPPGYGFADYNLTINIDLFDDAFELPNNDFATAAPIAEGIYTDLILRDDLYDYYYLYLHEGDTIDISLDYFPEEYPNPEEKGEILTNDIDVELYSDYNGTDYPQVEKSDTVLNETISFNATVSGKYFIFCIIWGGETPNSYNLTIDILETDDAHEDNDVFGDATRITVVEGPTRDTISHTETPRIRIKDDDYFVVNVPAGLAIIVEISQFGTENLDLELISLNGSIIDFSTNDAGYPEQAGPFPMNSSYRELYNGTDIYFRVSMNTGLSTSYFLNITIGPEDVLIPQESVPPFSKITPTKKAPDLLGGLILLAAGGLVLGGGTAAGLYAAKKTGTLEKVGKGFRKRFRRKPEG
ncbi:MAG: hypothetical protein JSW11_07770 [Candidatus Heimdallarchaeota archaeon]|nr:MAG: hypothetical protein JSW11_07770 [Candidatus Heimdallarchaeota archaeon]